MKEVLIRLYADMAKIVPDLEDRTAIPPGPGLERLRCFFCFTYEDPQLVHTRSRTWWIENIRELYYDMDKEYSRVASTLAIPRLVNEINVLRDPQRAVERFRLIALGPYFSGIPMGEVEKDGEEPLA